MPDHVAGGFKLTRLETARFRARGSEHLGRILEFAEITVLREDDGGVRSSNTGDEEYGRVNTTDTFFNLAVQFLHLGVQLCVYSINLRDSKKETGQKGVQRGEGRRRADNRKEANEAVRPFLRRILPFF